MGLKTWQQLVYSAEVLLPVPMIFKINKQLSLFLTSMLQLAQYFFPKLIVKIDTFLPDGALTSYTWDDPIMAPPTEAVFSGRTV